MSIRVTDLRLGNWVRHPKHFNGRVTAINALGFVHVEDRVGIQNIKAIDLSEAILICMGFSYAHGQYPYYINYKLPNGIYVSLCTKDEPMGYLSEAGKFYIGENHTEVAYVHDLQNFIKHVYKLDLHFKI